MRPTWIFDLDNTLHDADQAIFPRIDQMMTQFIMRHLGLTEKDALALKTRYYIKYGATMHGMRRHHGINPDLFLHETHRMAELLPLMHWDHRVGSVLARLPGEKILLSNGPQHYVEQIVRRMAITHHFSALYGVERAAYLPKPNRLPFLVACERRRVSPTDCIVVEDNLNNLRTAKQLGMHTVWLSRQPRRPVFVDARITSLTELPRLSLFAETPD